MWHLCKHMWMWRLPSHGSYGCNGSECHKFNIEQKKVIEKQLVDIRESISQNACLLSADHSLGFTTQVVKQIVESCDSMITVEHVLDKADIWDATLAQKVLDILENVAK